MRAVGLLALVLVLLFTSTEAIRIDKSDGGYEDIVVGIHRSVKPDENIVANIKTLFQSASDFLHQATDGRVYFKQVTIAIPNTWPARSQADRVSSNLFGSSHIHVYQPNPQYGNTPYTIQPRGCGEPGEYIHLTPEFLANLNTSTTEQFGNPAYMLVHEWAHLRYGVFEEYGVPGDKTYPAFYCEDGKIRANTCSQFIKFYPATAEGKPCVMYNGCRLSKDCIPVVLPDQCAIIESSIMFMPYLDTITKFCDQTEAHMHNAFAPNKHNALCGGKSAWEVISRNADFHGLAEPLPTKTTKVSFREAQETSENEGRIVMVLDVSGSMDGHGRLKLLKQSATSFIKDILPDGLHIGIVTFSIYARIVQDVRKLDNTTRKDVVGVIDSLSADGTTAIGKGLLAGVKALKAAGHSAEGGKLILMTDGEENQDPRMKEVLPTLLREKVNVNVMAFGVDADKELEGIAAATGGKAFFLKEGQGNILLDMESAFLDSTTDQIDDQSRPFTITEQLQVVRKASEISFTVDSDLGNDTAVTILSRSVQALDAKLVDPRGVVCSTCSRDKGVAERIIFRVPSPAAVGRWKLVVETLDGSEVDINVRVSSKPRDANQEPIRLRAYMNSLSVSSASDARLYAEVTKGPNVVVRARVVASVTRPSDDDVIQVELFDNGLGADTNADDGIYSAYFTQFNGKGRYSVVARVVDGGSALLRRGRPGSGGLPLYHVLPGNLPGEPATSFSTDAFWLTNAEYGAEETADVVGEPLPEFERFANGGSFQAKDDVTVATIPPGRIADMTAGILRKDNNGTYSVSLSWTCPGAHLDFGNASHIELRGSLNLTEFLEDFDSGVNVTEDQVLQGQLSLLPAGTHQNVTIILPQVLVPAEAENSLRGLHLRARAWNQENIPSEVSNTATAYFELTKMTPERSSTWVIVAAVCSTCVVIIIVAAVVFFIKQRNRHR